MIDHTVIDIITDFSKQFHEKTIFEILDDCIETEKNLGFSKNVNWFIELKYKIEYELKIYAQEHYIPLKWLFNNNKVERTKNGLKITNRTKDLTYIELYFPGEFNPKSLIIQRYNN